MKKRHTFMVLLVTRRYRMKAVFTRGDEIVLKFADTFMVCHFLVLHPFFASIFRISAAELIEKFR